MTVELTKPTESEMAFVDLTWETRASKGSIKVYLPVEEADAFIEQMKSTENYIVSYRPMGCVLLDEWNEHMAQLPVGLPLEASRSEPHEEEELMIRVKLDEGV